MLVEEKKYEPYCRRTPSFTRSPWNFPLLRFSMEMRLQLQKRGVSYSWIALMTGQDFFSFMNKRYQSRSSNQYNGRHRVLTFVQKYEKTTHKKKILFLRQFVTCIFYIYTYVTYTHIYIDSTAKFETAQYDIGRYRYRYHTIPIEKSVPKPARDSESW